MKVTPASLAIVFLSGTLAWAQGSGGSSGGSPGSSGSTSGSPSSSTTPEVVSPTSPRSQNPQTPPAPSDSTTVGRSPGTNPSDPQDLTNRSNPQDLTLPGANNPQDMTSGLAPNIPNIPAGSPNIPAGSMGTTDNQSRSGTGSKQIPTPLSRRRVEKQSKSSASVRGLPIIDVQKTCQTSGDVSGAAPDERASDACLSSERAARATIVKEWNEFLADDKASCLRPDVYLPSYVEWVTCLELRRDVRNLKQSTNSYNGRGSWIRNQRLSKWR